MSGYFLILSNVVGVLPAAIAYRKNNFYLSALMVMTSIISAFYHAVFAGLIEGHYPFGRASLLTLDHTLSHSSIAATILTLSGFSPQVTAVLNLGIMITLVSMTHDAVLSSTVSILFVLSVVVISAVGVMRKRLRETCAGLSLDSVVLSLLFLGVAFGMKAWGDVMIYDWGHGSWHIAIFVSASFMLVSVPPNQLSLWKMMVERCPRLRCDRGAMVSNC